MKIELNRIYSLKLNSGEEIIGKIIGINSDVYTVDSPLGTAMTPQGMQLMPAMFSTELNAEVMISIDSVAIIGEPRTDVADAYRESTTGIKVPDKQILLS